ncbi:MAG: hydantoinase/oxoprolinase family protein [Chloroflexi bacterium]|nr:hydantoinase/oxoprolinase family protein [Chloroflexota bacterium]
MGDQQTMPAEEYLIAVDVGGTFTDVVLADRGRETISCLKVPSSSDAAEAVILGVRQALEEMGLPPPAVTRLLHGTTVATNAILEKKGARVGLLTTEGFRDVLEIGRQIRPEIYNLFTRRPEPLARRRDRREVAERIRADGGIQRPLDPAQVRQEAQDLLASGVESIAICLLFSFLAPEHEQAVKRIIRGLRPDVPLSVSSELIPIFKEYERTSATVVNAYVLPVVGDYLRRLGRAVTQAGLTTSVEVMQSNGGTMSAASAAERPVHLVLSGPAGGVIAARALSQQCGVPNLIAVDIGGTSTDVCLLEGGTIPLTTAGEIAGYSIGVPMVPIHTVGAGGGSIAWVDSGGAVRVGPQSAGSVPGPACYRRGGKDATVTDAALAVGRLNPQTFAGNIQLEPAAAREAIRLHLSEATGLSVEQAAERIIDMAVANVVRAIRLVSVDKGHDPRDFALLAYGGAGPLLAAEVSEALEMTSVIVPLHPGNFSALGLLLTPVKHEATRSILTRLEALAADGLAIIIDELGRKALEMVRRDASDAGDVHLHRVASLRYLGQSYEIDVDVAPSEPPGEIAARFHQAHQLRYGFHIPEGAVELVNLTVTASAGGADTLVAAAGVKRDGGPAPRRDAGSIGLVPQAGRPVYHAGRTTTWPVFRREHLAIGGRVMGPAIIEEAGSTTIVLEGMAADVDDWGNLLIERQTKGQMS